MRTEVLHQLHDSPLSGGHFAAEKTLSRIKQRFWWPGLRASVEKYIAKCTRCAARSTAGKSRKAHLQTIEAKAPFRIVAADILGPVTLAKKSQARYILVISDLYTKYAVAVPLKDMTAKTVATTLVEEWILKFGAPDTLHTDQGTNFNSEVMKDVCQVFMIDKTRTSPYQPQGNGQVERFNRVIADTISKYCAEKPQEWDLHLPHVNFVYNTTVHKTLGTTPFSMLYGREAQYPIDLFYPKPPGDPRLELGEVGAELSDKLFEVHSHAQLTMGKEQRRQKDYYQKKVHGKSFKIGDRVWLFEPHKAKSRKFHLPWHGPYEVLSQTSEMNYQICKPGCPEKWQNIHFNRLKPYLGEYLPKRSERVATKTLPSYEEVADESDSSDQETKNRPYHVFRPTSAEIQANKNRPHVSFHDVPRVISAENDKEVSLINRPLYIDVPEPSKESSFPVYAEINESRNTPPSSDENNESERSDSMMIETTRNRVPPVRFGLDEYVVKPK